MRDERIQDSAKHPIQVVSRRTGLSADVIRVWERRYGAVAPWRSSTNRRLFSDEDIVRLRLLRQATRGGRRIGDVASLSTDALRSLVAEDDAATSEQPSAATHAARPSLERQVEICLEATQNLDTERLQRTLANASMEHGTSVLLDGLLRPLLTRIGERWRDGTMRVAHEHMTTSIVRTFLGKLKNGFQASDDPRPDLIVTTPAGQRHELGALMAAVTASVDGWHVTYLGANVPADEIAAAARQRGSRAVALSLVYPGDDPTMRDELVRLRGMLPDTALIAGGSAAGRYDEVLDEIGALRAADMEGLRRQLEPLRYAG
jgi:DNA-binding transcriptional MerR regulator/methylmalonyl-CoA mutase cobalamin-binding subunit